MNGELDPWKNRRRMAKQSMVAGLVFPVLLVLVPAERTTDLAAIAIPFYTFITVIVTAYYKFVTDDDKDQRASGTTSTRSG